MCQVPEGEVRETRGAAGVGGRVTGRGGGWRRWGVIGTWGPGGDWGGWRVSRREGGREGHTSVTFNNSLSF